MLPDTVADLISLGADLLKANNFRALAALIIFIAVKYGGPLLALKAPFFSTGKGKATLVILLAIANGLFQAFKPGGVPSFALLNDCLIAALSAAGVFSLRKPFIEKPPATIVPLVK